MEFILLFIFVAIIYLAYMVQRFYTLIDQALRYYEKHYLVFSKDEIEKASQFYKEEEDKMQIAREQIMDERNLTPKNEELFREFKKQEIYTSRIKEKLSLMIESNLLVLSGKKKIQEVIGKPMDYWLDSISKDEEKEIDEFIQKIKK